MSKNVTIEAIVLKTYNVGEADRFCILFSKELGRVSVRSNGARKLHSKLGASLLPGMVLNMQIRQSKTGNFAAQTELIYKPDLESIRRFSALQIITEVLLNLLPDEAPLIDVYSVTKNFIERHDESQTELLGAILQILWQLGYLPPVNDPSIVSLCTKEEAMFIQLAIDGNWQQADVIETMFEKRLLKWINNIVERECGKKLRSIEIQL